MVVILGVGCLMNFGIVSGCLWIGVLFLMGVWLGILIVKGFFVVMCGMSWMGVDDLVIVNYFDIRFGWWMWLGKLGSSNLLDVGGWFKVKMGDVEFFFLFWVCLNFWGFGWYMGCFRECLLKWFSEGMR